MNKDSEGPPFHEVEQLCGLMGVHYEVYDLKGSLRRVIEKMTTGKAATPQLPRRSNIKLLTIKEVLALPD